MNSVMKSLALLLLPAWDVNHPFAQRLHTVYAPHSAVTY